MKKLKVLNLSKGELFKITGGAGSCTGPGTCRESNCTCTGWLVSNHAWTETDASKETQMSSNKDVYSWQGNPGA